jgi:serine phosphatase RsbU (regulator of sigma subunit)/anti-sigma regulatory factor (Ser/Thr protein kinase)
MTGSRPPACAKASRAKTLATRCHTDCVPLPDGPLSRPAGDAERQQAEGDAAVFELGEAPDAVRRGRHFVEAHVRASGAEPLAYDAALVVSELLANALQHGLPPVSVRVQASPTRVMIEVRDASLRSPIRVRASNENMTGRGLALVDRLAAAWGVEAREEGGKTVWCELTGDAAVETHRRSRRGAPLDSWDERAVADGRDRYTVALGDVPTNLLLDAKAHIDNLVREFSLAASASASSGVAVPAALADLMNTVVHGFDEARAAIKRQALAAAARGDVRTSLTLYLPLEAADAAKSYLGALDEADKYSRAARLLTLETPPGHRVFRRWYLEAVIEQLQHAADGLPPAPAQPFEERLLDEVTWLSSAQRVTERAARLQRVTAALARSRTPQDVADVVISEGVGALDAAGGSLLVPADDGEHLAVPGAFGYGDDFVDQLRAERVDAQLPAATAMRTGEAVWIESRLDRDRRFPEMSGFEPSTIAMCAVPLEVGGRRIGALRFSFNTPRLFDEDERNFVLALAAQTAQTLERSELYLAERKATLQLQRALLPQTVSAVPGWDIAAHYSPAGDQEVGGDWFDVIPLPDGRVVAVVGDVMGRGIAAAAAMAQMRSSVRAYVAVDPDPRVVLGKLDHYFEIFEQNQLVTLLYLLADIDSGLVQVANAGHLPPLLLAPDGTGRRLDMAPALPFGVVPDDRTPTIVTVAPGEALVAVTDGLVERRGEDIDLGIDRLLRGLRLSDRMTAEDVRDAVLTTAAAERVHDDDVTVLVLRRRR